MSTEQAQQVAYTPEPWHSDGCTVISTGLGITCVAHTAIGGACRSGQETNAARIAAAINFCKGFPTEALANGGLVKIVEAARAAYHEYTHPATGDGDFVSKMRALNSALSLLSPEKKEG